jgi:hypothetical protein
MASWQRDRFASANSGSDGGNIETVPVIFDGNRLELNASTKRGGSVTAEIWDAAGTKRLARSRPVSGDSLRHRLEWEDSADIAAFAAKPVTVRFLLKNAKLFAFAFRSRQ